MRSYANNPQRLRKEHSNLIQIKQSTQKLGRRRARAARRASSLTPPPAPTEALLRWEAAATESARQLDEAQRRARTAEAEGEACAAREAALRERV